jgi:lysophospholipase L1-like esterase
MSRRLHRTVVIVGLVTALVLAACSSSPAAERLDSTTAAEPTVSSSPQATVAPLVSIPAGDDLIVAVGDSFAAGVGAPNAIGPCGRSDLGWTALLARELDRPFVNLACGGAMLADIDAQIDQIPASATLVLLSGGGNDAGAAELIRGCRSGDCLAAADAYIARLPEVTGKLTDVVRRAAVGRRAVLISYAVGATAACDEHAPQDYAAIEKATYEAAVLMRATVDTVRAEGFDVLFAGAPPFAGHEICDVGEPWAHGRASMLYMHPNDHGHQELARLVAEVLRGAVTTPP